MMITERQKKINSGEILGVELILDLHNCDSNKFNNKTLNKFLKDLVKHVDMTATKLFTWEYLEDNTKSDENFFHLKGYSKVQFLVTSNITLHSFDNLKKMSLNIYSCKDFNEESATEFCKNYFNAEVKQSKTLLRY